MREDDQVSTSTETETEPVFLSDPTAAIVDGGSDGEETAAIVDVLTSSDENMNLKTEDHSHPAGDQEILDLEKLRAVELCPASPPHCCTRYLQTETEEESNIIKEWLRISGEQAGRERRRPDLNALMVFILKPSNVPCLEKSEITSSPSQVRSQENKREHFKLVWTFEVSRLFSCARRVHRTAVKNISRLAQMKSSSR